jgi:adenosylmethionine-8-amino-7-oxononanoate aminotransferase
MVYAPQPNPLSCELGGETPSECAVRCAEAVERLIEYHGADTVAAVIAEPIASHGTEGPKAAPGEEYWPMLRQICDRHGVLLIADEVVCGFGRTGKWFGVEHFGVVPDLMTVAKGLISSYLPMAATIATKEVADAFAGGENIFRQSLTFGGHPVTAAAALRNIEIIESEGLVENSSETGAYMLEQLTGLREDHPIVGDTAGLGLMIGVGLVKDRETGERFGKEVKLADRLTESFRREGLFLRAGDGGVNFSPPLCITRAEVDEIVAAVDRSLSDVERQLSIR